MIRMTLLLCAGLFAAMYFGGADRGQQRFGLVEQVKPAVVHAAAVVDEPASPSVSEDFTPAAPLIAVASTADADLSTRVIHAKSANVRSGPGTTFDVVGKLNMGEAVTLVSQSDGAEGWSLIRIEGDGIEGYVANRLLTE
jgi:uncharacterized protein YgiM (DUF1202 family)